MSPIKQSFAKNSLAVIKRVHQLPGPRCIRWYSQNSLQDGVVKLEETGRIVKGLKRELTELQPLLEAKASEAEGLLNQVC